MRTSERGSAVVETALAVPVLLVLLGLVVLAGRLTSASAEVTAAARDGARAASLRDLPGPAVADAEATVAGALSRAEVPCASTSVRVEAGNIRPGGSVSVAVHCELDLSGLSPLSLPGSRTVSARSTAVVDAYRSVP